jgi:urate oxidase
MPLIRGSSHGESRVRMLRIVRRGDRHDPRDLTVSCRFEGYFTSAFEDGRTDGLPPAETLKNIIFAVVRERGGEELEAIGIAIAERLLARAPRVTRVRVELSEQPWARLDAGGKAQGQAFAAGSAERRTASVTSNGDQIAVIAGAEDITVMRTSGFAPPRSADDESGATDGLQRLLVASLSVRWTYISPDVTFGPYRQGVRAAIIDTFAREEGRSVQQTLYAIGDVVLATYDEIAEVSLALHERPYRPADLFLAAIENPDELFVAADEPLGIVELTVTRG